MESSIIENHKNDELVHFFKINIFGETGVGKSSLISLFENYNNNEYTIKKEQNKECDNESIDSESENISSISEEIKRIVIEFNEIRNLYFNICETNLNNYDSIKMNLDTLLYQTECIIIIWDNNNPETFDNIPNFASTIKAGIEENKFKKVPIYIIRNKMDLKNNDEKEINQSIEQIEKYIIIR